MKKKLNSFIIALSLLVVDPNEVPREVEPIPPESTPTSISQILANIILYILGFSAALAVLFIIIGGLRFIVSSGDQNAADQGKKIILYAILGLIVIIFSFVIVTFVIQSAAPVIVP